MMSLGGFETRESTHDDAPAPREPTGPAYSDVKERADRREHIADAVRKHRTGGDDLQTKLDDNRRMAGEANAWAKRRKELVERTGDPTKLPPARAPGANMSVRESIEAAIETVKLPRQVVTEVDPLAGSVKTDIARDPQDADHAPSHWEGVHHNEFRTLPEEFRRTAHQHTPVVTTFNGWRMALGDPKRSWAAFSDIFTRNPLTEQQKQEFANWARDPNRKVPQRPQFQFQLPPGMTPAAWAQASPAVRNAIHKQAEMVFMAAAADQLINNPATRLDAAKLLFDTFVPIQHAFGQAMAQVPQQMPQNAPQQHAADHHVSTANDLASWAKDKTHLNMHIPAPGGGTTEFRKVMGMMLQKDTQLFQAGQPQIWGLVNANGSSNVGRANAILLAAVQASGQHTPAKSAQRSAGKQRRTPSSMRGGAPSFPSPGNPQAIQNDGSVKSAIRAALQGITFA